ncbi:Mus81p [Malassezia vespertilionis]|uniref:Crossover junction endonuclease MUS81 n=1 Tax=Malassezia vespertilionis TaxID=2020962 RepID=A0A2N1JBK9_9BASI|nr:Mus81p [Malassezia vespertilionis]
MKKRRTFRKFSYRGVDLDQLVELPNEKFVELVSARARRRFNRGLKRGPMTLIKKLRKAKMEAPPNEKPTIVRTHLRNMIVVPEMIGSVIGVYNGKVFTTVEIKPEMTGHYLGEFAITYIPTRHVGLYKKVLAEQCDEAPVSKAELISLAQPHCDSDYSISGGGSRSTVPAALTHRGSSGPPSQTWNPRRSFVSAWNGMKTLIDKAYVFRVGNPPVFYLSEQGLCVAKAITELEGIVDQDALPLPAPEAFGLRASPEPTETRGAALTESPRASQAALFLPQKRQRRSPPRHTPASDSDDGDAYVVDLIQSSQENVYCAEYSHRAGHSSDPIVLSPYHQGEPVRISISLIDSSPMISRQHCSTAELPSSPVVHTARASNSGAETLSLPMCHTLPANSYTIHMVMDHREVRQRFSHGTEASRRVTFKDAMAQRGITCDLRALELGDIIWVAKPRADNPSHIAQLWSSVQEVVLDAVVERKRLDDLASSIFDGRWHDQKLRLRFSGIDKVYYLIEDIDVANLVQRHGASIQTALSSTQIIDGFHVHRTANGEGTADFLANLHRALETLYSSTPLHVLRDSAIDRDHYSEMRASLRTQFVHERFHTSFHTFQALNGKTSSSGTLQDTWTRMLLCIQGLSSEKAEEIVRRWPTMHALLRDYAAQEAATAPGERSLVCERMIAKAVDPNTPLTRRRIGSVLSARIYQILRSNTFVE